MAMVLGIIAISCFGQRVELEELDQIINNGHYKEAIEISKSIDTIDFTVSERAEYNYLLSKIYRSKNEQSNEIHHLMRSRDLFKSIDSLNKVEDINLTIVSVIANNTDDIDEARIYFDEFLKSIEKENNHVILSRAYRELGSIYYNEQPELALEYFKKALKEVEYTDDEFLKGRIYNGLGAVLASDDEVMELDSAMIMYDKAMRIYKKYDRKSWQAVIRQNRAVVYTKQKKYQKALDQYAIVDTSKLDEFKLAVKSYLYRHWGDTYRAMGDYKKALESYEVEKIYMDSIKVDEQKKAIKDIETKYKTAEKELENQMLASDLKINRIFLVSTAIALLLLLIISFLGYNYTTKKRKIAEQEKAIETQKMQTMLREQELNEIDVMLESQEKERQRIANDLHDNLGSLLSALKLNFNTLGKREIQDNSSKKLFEKTEELINETYVQVRNISHLKNLGVIGKEGLLIAVKKMAEKMSVINELEFSVIPFGLNNRLESSLEIVLFRMIQELCSNIIKHSRANEVNIYLTQHDNHQLNIIIEDDGVGFDPQLLNKESSGIGLKNIEKKVEQLGGTFTIDSSKNKGTTIIIDIPL
ncbi:hypothetical protein NBRC110019_25450 [Neptunitalea chrysea]|uniref:Oxygen sensor histidine kinase NreB n=1 Tax=Neptunitalea chrysea TaxID=1647581 RepID=A0A9W6B8N5_9FLAO|nr:sensor histidine kinase [Neptunitalea chrysea]GLB53504.1 hypothetical protein NBRC110019_25450 [Neptunitalea chrysea]